MNVHLLKDLNLSEDTFVSPAEHHHKRLGIAYQTVSFTLVALGLSWLAWRSNEGDLALIAINAAYVGAGLYLWFRIRSGRFYFAAMALHLFLFTALTQICLVFDVPDTAAPRVTQIYFLALAFLSYVTFRGTSLSITYAFVLAELVGFVIFSSTTFAAPFSDPLPEHVRLAGSWMHSTVATGIMCVCVYIMQSEFSAHSGFGRRLTTALAERQFELYYQPQVDGAGTIQGAEALLRWLHPKRGFIRPDEFIPAAEKLGLMQPIGKWVLETACAQLALWRDDAGKADLWIAVNVSPQQFNDPNFVEMVKEIVTRHGIDPAKLKLELTENLMLGGVEDIIAKMDSLAEFGIALSLDDFGTGYSSLKYLKRMPFTQVKIDKGFIRDMLLDERDAVIVKGIVQLGHELGLSIIAEGVETREQHDYLLELGCVEFQGYLFGPPMPMADFETALVTP